MDLERASVSLSENAGDGGGVLRQLDSRVLCDARNKSRCGPPCLSVVFDWCNQVYRISVLLMRSFRRRWEAAMTFVSM
jgi:hypothetical protein